MRARRFSEEQIIGILREQQRGAKTAEVLRPHGISDDARLPFEWDAQQRLLSD